MLGKLARWLRMLGHDVEYSNSLDDVQLLEMAKEERRVLLTRDFALYQHATARGVDAFYVEGQTEPERLAELALRFQIRLNIDMTTSRCPKCNTPVELAAKEEVAGKVEDSTFDHYGEFWKCPKCGQIYWQGAHWNKIRKTLAEAEDILEKKEKSRS
jgi:uncharacterized protein with PIN domain